VTDDGPLEHIAAMADSAPTELVADVEVDYPEHTRLSNDGGIIE
jgi:hypothetical protein